MSAHDVIPPEPLIARYRQISSPTVYDVLLKMGYPNQAISSLIRPLFHGSRIAGPARPIHGQTMAKADERWGTAFSYAFFRAIRPGDIIVFDCGGHDESGPWGGNTGATARAKGAAGIIIDGGTRDYTDLVDMRFPTFCRFVTPVLAHGRFEIRGFDEPITITGQGPEPVAVRSGDLIVADDDGIVVVPEGVATQAIEFAEYAEDAERRIRAAIDAGEDREAIDARIDRWALLKDWRTRNA